MDGDVFDSDRQLVLSVARVYLHYACKGDRNCIIVPERYESKINQLLVALGMSETKVVVSALVEHNGLSHINLLRSHESKNLLNIALAWYLVVAYITAEFNDL